MMENLLSRINELREEINNFSENDRNAAELFRIKFIGSNGSVKSLMGEMKNVAAENKREMGKVLNDLKVLAESKHEEIKKSNDGQQSPAAKSIDLTLPGNALPVGGRHPISIVRNKIVSIFYRLGFAVAEARRLKTTGIILRRSIYPKTILPGICRILFISMRIRFGFYVHIPVVCRFGRWKKEFCPSGLFVLAAYIAMKLSVQGRIVFSTR